MNKFVAVSATAAIPTAAPAMNLPTSPANTLPAGDLKLIELAEQLISAVAESRRLFIIAEDMRWDEHQKEPPGYKAAKRAYEKAATIETKLEQRISDIQATTIEGMIAKARCAEVYDFENLTVDFGASIVFDLLAFASKIRSKATS